jgi:hypothetical protein
MLVQYNRAKITETNEIIRWEGAVSNAEQTKNVRNKGDGLCGPENFKVPKQSLSD